MGEQPNSLMHGKGMCGGVRCRKKKPKGLKSCPRNHSAESKICHEKGGEEIGVKGPERRVEESATKAQLCSKGKRGGGGGG